VPGGKELGDRKTRWEGVRRRKTRREGGAKRAATKVDDAV